MIDLLSKYVSFVSRISRALACVGGFILLLSAVLVSLDVFARKLLGIVPFHSFELTGYGLAVAVALGQSFALVDKAHIRVDVLYGLASLRLRGWLDLAALIGLATSIGVLAFYASLVALGSYALTARSDTTLAMPIAIPQAVWAVGLIWFATVALLLSVRVLLLLLRGREKEVAAIVGSGTMEPLE